LARWYRPFLHHRISTFKSVDVLRFLGHSVPATGNVHANFKGEVTSSLKQRPEGVRLRHTVNGNSVKVYDKQGSVLRVETTIVHPEHFRVYRPAEGDAQERLRWLRLRRGVADLWQRGQVSQPANRRYLEALASVTGKTPLREEALQVCRVCTVEGRRYRALNPWSPDNGALLEAVSRGEFTLAGLRNRDLRRLLYPREGTAQENESAPPQSPANSPCCAATGCCAKSLARIATSLPNVDAAFLPRCWQHAKPMSINSRKWRRENMFKILANMSDLER